MLVGRGYEGEVQGFSQTQQPTYELRVVKSSNVNTQQSDGQGQFYGILTQLPPNQIQAERSYHRQEVQREERPSLQVPNYYGEVGQEQQAQYFGQAGRQGPAASTGYLYTSVAQRTPTQVQYQQPELPYGYQQSSQFQEGQLSSGPQISGGVQASSLGQYAYANVPDYSQGQQGAGMTQSNAGYQYQQTSLRQAPTVSNYQPGQPQRTSSQTQYSQQSQGYESQQGHQSHSSNVPQNTNGNTWQQGKDLTESRCQFHKLFWCYSHSGIAVIKM